MVSEYKFEYSIFSCEKAKIGMNIRGRKNDLREMIS
jgi:hypothetical protein|tara:strand:- start:383 stop:490 length:108 start_codon:yes stop_codon:yes gene_type:complete